MSDQEVDGLPQHDEFDRSAIIKKSLDVIKSNA
jgi:hypothetical protein